MNKELIEIITGISDPMLIVLILAIALAILISLAIVVGFMAYWSLGLDRRINKLEKMLHDEE